MEQAIFVEMTYPNGCVRYRGYVRRGQYHGYGALFSKEGKIEYQGSFRRGKYSGEGYLFRENQLVKYVGRFGKGKFDGPGKLIRSNGHPKYVGQFKQGKYNGFGQLFDRNGMRIYSGFFCEGARQDHTKRNRMGYEWMGSTKLFKGHWSRDLRNGEGFEFYYNGRMRTQGRWVDGKLEGHAIMWYPNQTIKYSCNFREGVRNGPGIEYHENQKEKYVGSWVNEEYDGTAKMYHENGTLQYEGEFKDSYFHGYGILYDYQGQRLYQGLFNVSYRYSGPWREGFGANGVGTMTYESGVIYYQGEFKDGYMDGFGTATDEETGLVYYRGQWKMDAYEGKGIQFSRVTGLPRYDGQFHDGVRHGRGVTFDDNGNPLGTVTFHNGNKYEGQWDEETGPIGYGVVYDSQGFIARCGNFEDGKLSGHCKTFKNGSVFHEGQYVAGKPEGQGVEFHPNGKVAYRGMFKRGNRDGFGRSYDENEVQVYEGDYENGRPHGLGTETDGEYSYFAWFKNGYKHGKCYVSFAGIPQYDMIFHSGMPVIHSIRPYQKEATEAMAKIPQDNECSICFLPFQQSGIIRLGCTFGHFVCVRCLPNIRFCPFDREQTPTISVIAFEDYARRKIAK